MIGDIAKAIGQLDDRRFLGVMALGIGLTLALLAGVTWAFIFGLKLLIGFETIANWPFIGWIANAAGVPLMIGMSIFLMVPVASVFTGLFLDKIAAAVEAKHYPTAQATRQVGLMETLADSLGFLGLICLVNLVALILYLLLAPIAALLFWAVNGLLLGREYAQMVAIRHMPRQDANRFRKAHRGQIFLMGVLMAIPLTVPLLNLLIPVLGAASFTHLYHRLSRRSGA